MYKQKIKDIINAEFIGIQCGVHTNKVEYKTTC